MEQQTSTTPQPPDPRPPATSFNTRPWNQTQQQQQPSSSSSSSHFTLPSSPTPRIAIGIPPPTSFQQSHIRPLITPNNNNNNNNQSFQTHGGIIRVSTSSPNTNNNNNNNNNNQPWLSTQGKPHLPSPSTLRPQQHIITQSFQQRPTNEHYGPQFPPPRSITQQQQQMGRGMPVPLGSQKSPIGIPQTGLLNKTNAVVVEMEEVSNRVVTKRSVRDLLKQIDQSEKFETVVEDVLVDIAEDFVESITRFGCLLAKHRKSAVLETKDVLLHIERDWNMSLPGFGGDEIKTYKKPIVSEVHRERISAVKKSSVGSDSAITAGAKSLGGQSGGNTKSHVAKGLAATTEAA